MIDGLKPYPGYKDSGSPWLGSVPQHWSVLPNRAIFAEVNHRNHPDEEMLSVTITRGVIQQKALLADSSKKDSSNLNKSAYKLVCQGDIAYNKMRAWQRAIGASNFRGIISPAYVVMRLRHDHNPRYFHELYRTPHFAKEAERWSYGITSDMWSLRPEHFRMIYSALPPREEQDAIVRFLDHANRKIERYIRAKKKLIALLNEQKQAIIHRAVTRGLDPNVRLKPAGIPWLGEIPEHWDMRKLKFLIATRGGMTPSKAERSFWSGSIPWVSPKDMKVPEIWDSQDHISEAALHRTGITLLEPDAVLIVVRGMILARTFPVAVTRVPVTVNQDMKALIPRSDLQPEFLAYLLAGIQRDLLNLVEEAGHGTRCLRSDELQNFVLPVPSVTEQSSIVGGLTTELRDAEQAIVRTEREIALIREYRTRLVADVVTGQLDVREAAAKLSEEPRKDDVELVEETSEGEAELSDVEDMADSGTIA